MTTFDIDTTPTKYKEILDGIKEQAHALRCLHNPQTWRLSALTFALHLHDCTILFENARDKWIANLPFSDAWDVDFFKWKNDVWKVVYDINSFTTNEKYCHWEQLCDSDFKVFMQKANACLKGDVPISDVLDFLSDKKTELSEVVRDMGQKLSEILNNIDKIPEKASSQKFVEFYNNLMSIYLKENENNPFPIDNGDEVISFDKWVASKSVKRRIKLIPSKLSSIHNSIMEIKFWKDIWSESVDLETRDIDKENLGRSIYAIRMRIIGNKSYPCKTSLNKLFSSLALCTKIWEYEASQNAGAFDNLSESRQEMIYRLDALIEKGDWVEPATIENMKDYLRQILGVGSKKLYNEDVKLSESIWKQFESGNNENVTFLKLVGYSSYYRLLPERKGDTKLKKSFFGNNGPSYQNIAHGRPGNNGMTEDFKDILPLLDKYRPKKAILTPELEE